jgi:hypothetical protein
MISPKRYPITFSVEYPNRELDRLGTFVRLIIAIPIVVVLASVSGGGSGEDGGGLRFSAGGLLFLGPLLLILFRQKYPRWWFDWNVALLRFMNRVLVYLALMDDRYPSTDDQQGVRLEIPFPDVKRDLNRWLPLLKWLLAIPHVIVLMVLSAVAVVAVVAAWFSILFTGRYPRGLFDFVEGVLRWQNRVVAYAIILATDLYPPFSLE